VVNATLRSFYLREEEPVPVLQEAGWAPGPVWTGEKISFLTGFDTRSVQPVASGYTGYVMLLRPTGQLKLSYKSKQHENIDVL